jgi:hypothetical protein
MKKQLTLLSMLVISGACLSQRNLISNSTFDNNTDYWRGDCAKTSSIIKKTGAASGMIVQYVGAEWKGIDQTVTLPKNTVAVTFSVWMKAEAIEEQAEKYNTGLMNIEFMTGSEAHISYENIAALTGTDEWTEYKKTIAISPDTRKARIMIALGKTNGTLFFDDVKAVALTKEQFDALQK